MSTHDGREIARQNEQRILKLLYKFSWLRTRDLAAMIWMRARGKPAGFEPSIIAVSASALRMGQRTLLRLRQQHLVIWTQAPDGSTIYGLSVAGARLLSGLGIPAKSAKDAVRRVSMSYYHHRRIANEVAIVALLQGYRVASEAEISAGSWLGGLDGIHGKKADVLVRDGKDIWWIEVERSRRNKRDYDKLLAWLEKVWPAGGHVSGSAVLPAGMRLVKVLFVCSGAFIDHLITDLKKLGWSETQISLRISAVRLLYVTDIKFLTT